MNVSGYCRAIMQENTIQDRSFTCVSQLDGTVFRCHFLFIQTAISLRHSDTVDVRFMVNGRRITVALPHVAFVEYAKRTGGVLTDEGAIDVARACLQERLEKGEDVEEITVPSDEVLARALKGADTTVDLNPPGTMVPQGSTA